MKSPKSEHQKKTQSKASASTSLPEWFLEETDTLKEIIQWWKSREAASMDAAGRRPLFIGKTKNTGFRINEEILQRALKKAKSERAKTGGNLSQLLEWLLWIYIGSPEDVVEDPRQPRRDS